MYGRQQKKRGGGAKFKQIGDYFFKPDEFDKKHFLGGGAFGKVYLGYHTKTKKEVAVKVIPMSSMDSGTADIEIKLFR